MRRTGKTNTILDSEESGFMTERPFSGLLTSRINTMESDYSGLYSSRRNDEIFTAREKTSDNSYNTKANLNQRYNQEFTVTLGKDPSSIIGNAKITQFKEENSHKLTSINEDDSLDINPNFKQAGNDKKNRNKTLLTNIINYTISNKSDEDKETHNEDLKRFNATLANVKSPRLAERENKDGAKTKREKSNEKQKAADASFPGILNYYSGVEIKKEDTIHRINTENAVSKSTDSQEGKKKEIAKSEQPEKKLLPNKDVEKEKVSKLDEKSNSKDKIILELKKYNEEITEALKSSEKQFNNTLADKEKQINQLTNEKIKLAEKMLEYEKNTLNLNKELQSLQENIKQKSSIITDLKQQNYKLKIEFEKNMESSETDEDYIKRINALEAENFKFKMQLENQNHLLQYEYQEQIRKLQHSLEMANLENEYLRSHTQSQESNRSQTTSDISNISTEKGQLKNDKKVKQDKRRELCGNISQEFDFKIEQDDDKIKDLQEYKKQTHKFLSKLNELVINLSPPNHYKDSPTLKDVWKWIQNILKEYMNLKKKKNESKDKHEDLISNFESLLKVKSTSELLSSLTNLISSEEKNRLLVSKFKSMLDQPKINEINEYERRLDRKTIKVS